MNAQNMVKMLTDPLGIPFFPFLFQFLMVLTFTIHIIFVNLTIGGSFFSVYGYVKREGNWFLLSRTMLRSLPVFISFTILFGVAPLLFVQVLYDPFWYTSSVLSAWWVIAFVISLMIAYSFVYIFYLNSKNQPHNLWIIGLISFLLFVLNSIIMHVLNIQSLHPEKWFEWYASANSVDTSGTGLHYFKLSRYLHFIVPGFAMSGIFMMLYNWYYKDREDIEQSYKEWIGTTGAKIAFYATLIQMFIGLWWLLSEDFKLKLYLHPLLFISVLLGVVLAVFLFRARKNVIKNAIPSALLFFMTVFSMSYTREILRMKYLKEIAGFSVFQRKVNLDIGSTSLFIITFLLGLVIIGFLLAVVFKTGKKKEEFIPAKTIEKLGTFSISTLTLWLIVMVVMGLIIVFS